MPSLLLSQTTKVIKNGGVCHEDAASLVLRLRFARLLPAATAIGTVA